MECAALQKASKSFWRKTARRHNSTCRWQVPGGRPVIRTLLTLGIKVDWPRSTFDPILIQRNSEPVGLYLPGKSAPLATWQVFVNVAEWLRRDTRMADDVTLKCRLFGGAGSNPAVDETRFIYFCPFYPFSFLVSGDPSRPIDRELFYRRLCRKSPTFVPQRIYTLSIIMRTRCWAMCGEYSERNEDVAFCRLDCYMANCFTSSSSYRPVSSLLL